MVTYIYIYMQNNRYLDGRLQVVKDLIREDQWNEQVLMKILPQEVVNYILTNMRPTIVEGVRYIPIWMLETTGKFIVKSAWEYIRQRQEKNLMYKTIWVKGLPFKMVFLMWRI